MEIEELTNSINERLDRAEGSPRGVASLADLDTAYVQSLNVKEDLRLAARALTLLLDTLRTIRRSFEVINDEARHHADRLAAWREQQTARLDFELHLLSIYERLYAISELVRDPKTPTERPPEDLAVELERIEFFRGALVTHKKRVVRALRRASIGKHDELELRVNVGLQTLSDADAAQLRAIFARNEPRLPREARGEENWNEQLQQLYANLPEVAPEDQRDVKALIARNGVQSDSPVVLARIVYELTLVYFPD